MTDDTHGCPGDCGASVPRHQLACKPCWFRLPQGLRDAINRAYRNRQQKPRVHVLALREAMRWYAEHPRGDS